jgi:hypothetical protein
VNSIELFRTISFIYLFFAVLGLELRALHLESLHQPYFCEGFLEIGSHELFAWAVLNLNHPDLYLLC